MARIFLAQILTQFHFIESSIYDAAGVTGTAGAGTLAVWAARGGENAAAAAERAAHGALAERVAASMWPGRSAATPSR